MRTAASGPRGIRPPNGAISLRSCRYSLEAARAEIIAQRALRRAQSCAMAALQRRGGGAEDQAATAADVAAERPPCTLGALARILQLETLDIGAVPSSASLLRRCVAEDRMGADAALVCVRRRYRAPR